MDGIFAGVEDVFEEDPFFLFEVVVLVFEFGEVDALGFDVGEDGLAEHGDFWDGAVGGVADEVAFVEDAEAVVAEALDVGGDGVGFADDAFEGFDDFVDVLAAEAVGVHEALDVDEAVACHHHAAFEGFEFKVGEGDDVGGGGGCLCADDARGVGEGEVGFLGGCAHFLRGEEAEFLGDFEGFAELVVGDGFVVGKAALFAHGDESGEGLGGGASEGVLDLSVGR